MTSKGATTPKPENAGPGGAPFAGSAKLIGGAMEPQANVVGIFDITMDDENVALTARRPIRRPRPAMPQATRRPVEEVRRNPKSSAALTRKGS